MRSRKALLATTPATIACAVAVGITGVAWASILLFAMAALQAAGILRCTAVGGILFAT